MLHRAFTRTRRATASLLASYAVACPAPPHTSARHWGGIFSLLFIYFICSQLLFNATFFYHVGLYGLLIPSFLLAIYHGYLPRHYWPHSAHGALLAAFFVALMVHAMVWTYDDQSLARSLRDIALNGLFVLMALRFFSYREAHLRWLVKALIVTVLVMGSGTLLHYLWMGDFSTRMDLIGRAHNPIPIGNIYAMVALAAGWLCTQPGTHRHWKYAGMFCILLVLACIIVTTQRGPLLGLAVGGAVVCAYAMQRRMFVALILLAALLIADFMHYHLRGISWLSLDAAYRSIEHFFTRRDSFRLPIWQHAIALIEQRPWQGYGLQSRFMVEGIEGGVNPHNLVLGVLYYTGVIGLFFFLLPLLRALIETVAQPGRAPAVLALIWLVHGLAATATNLAHPVKAAAPIWMIYWLPIALAFAYARPTQNHSVGHA